MENTKRVINNNRFKNRLLFHHIPLLCFSMALVLLLFIFRKTPDVITGLSFATAYSGIALLAATLILGPLNKIFKRINPVSTDLRRDIGLWAAVVSLVHVIFGLQVHLRGNMWALFLRPDMDFPFFRSDIFGAANHTGFIAALVLIVLFITSNDFTLRQLGPGRWKRIQKWNYALFALVALHGVLYQIIEKRVAFFVFLFAGLLMIVVIMRIAGSFFQKRFA